MTLNTYSKLVEFLGTRSERKVPSVRSTTVHRVAPDAVAVRYHHTDVVTAYDNGTFRLNSGGYRTATTKARLNEHSPAHVYQANYDWFLSGTSASSQFFDGVLVNAYGQPVHPHTHCSPFVENDDCVVD